MPGRANEIGGGRTSIAGGFLRVRATPTQMLVQDVLSIASSKRASTVPLSFRTR